MESKFQYINIKVGNKHLSSYCGLVDAKKGASDKYLPVKKPVNGSTRFQFLEKTLGILFF